jgi:ubiquinone/menaquinone biosynthesis C-methylase UbiE
MQQVDPEDAVTERAPSLWDSVWLRHEGLAPWDGLCEEIWASLVGNLDDLRGLQMLEAGCGRGRIAVRAAAGGAQVSLLDVSAAALQVAQAFLRGARQQAHLCQGDLLAMPFETESFDVVWNAGVIEHFAGDDQVRAIREMARVCRARGLVLTFVPNAQAIIYRIAKGRAERSKQWIWGHEEPVISMRSLFEREGLALLQEKAIAVHQEVSFAREFITRRQIPLMLVDQLLHHVLRPLGRAGYLLASVGKKEA